MNKCIFIGNLTKDPESQKTNSGVDVCRFSIAVNRTYTNSNGEREVDFINIVAWRGLADNCNKYLTKGSKVCVVGSMQNRTYDDKDGNRRYASDVIADEVEFVGSRASNAEGGVSTGTKPAAASPIEPVEDDGPLPF